MINYIYSFWDEPNKSSKNNEIYHTNENIEDEYSYIDKKLLINVEDLVKINLKPPNNIIPGPSRNMPPIDKFNLRMLNKAQLDTILSVKLKPIPIREMNRYYEPKHPVLRELLQKFKNK